MSGLDKLQGKPRLPLLRTPCQGVVAPGNHRTSPSTPPSGSFDPWSFEPAGIVSSGGLHPSRLTVVCLSPSTVGPGPAPQTARMAHAIPLPIPCPVQLGTIKSDSLEAQLHEYVKQGNYVKVKKILKKGICVDTTNSLGQTALFTAALLGLGKLVDVLLEYGSDPNHRCYDGSTPVHAAAFSGNQWILSKLLDAGGDLRVHDKNGRNPQYWAMSAGKESSAQMLEFIRRCASHMQAAIQNFPSDLLRKVGSSKVLVCTPSLFGGISQGTADSALAKLLKGGANSLRNIYSFGFGKFYLTGSTQLGYLASLPIIGDKEVFQADDEPTFSFHTGPYMIMTNLMWGSSRVTVKELSLKPHQNCSKRRLADLLIAEQEYSSKLRHPHLLQLMAVCLSNDLEKTRLVYERVNFGSLYSILHERRSEFPVLHMETIVHLLLQVNDALRFLQSRGYIHRSLTSYAVQIVSAGEAKLTNLEYMIESKDGGDHSDLTRVPVPAQLYRWCAPEVILEKATTVKSDIYSFCIVMQEALTETLPWNGLEGSGIKELIVSGQHLETDVRLPKPYYDIAKTGLEPKQKDRSMSLQDIRYILKNDLKDLIETRMGHSDESSTAQKHDIFSDINICLLSTSNYKRETLKLQGEAIAKTAVSFTAPRCSVSPAERETIINRETITCIQPVTLDVSQDIASEYQRTDNVSDMDDSLCSFEINEIYACYPELHEDIPEELDGLDRALKDETKQQNVDEDRAHSQILPPPPKIQLVEQPNYSEEGSSSEMGTEYSLEEGERLSEASEPCLLRQLGADVRESVRSPSKTEQHISKCVLNLKISQTLLQQATDSLYRTGMKLDKLETVQTQHKLLKKIQEKQVSKQKSIESYLDKIDDILKNIKIPFSGANAFLWKAVGPPSRNYIPPPLPLPGECRAWELDHFQAISEAVKESRTVQSQMIECFEEKRKNKDDDCQSDFSSSMVMSTEAQVAPDYQLYPHVAVRWEKNVNLQYHRGTDSNSGGSGIKEETWFFPKSVSEIYNSRRWEERRMVQSEWATEVKQMAKRAASGQLGLLPPYPPSECTSESEAESMKEAFPHVTFRGQESAGWQRRDGRRHAGDGTETWDLSRKMDESEESDLESVLRPFVGRSWQSLAKDEQAEYGANLPKNSISPTKAEDTCCEHSSELTRSSNSSPDISDEFFTPDPDYFFSPAAQGNSEQEISSSEDELEVTQETCVQKPVPSDTESGEKIFLCNTAVKNRGSNEVGVNQLNHTPVASAEASQEIIPKETLKEFKEKDISLTDIQDLSSISCEQENFCKDIICKTPRMDHAPTSVSTPLSPVKKVSSVIKKCGDCHEIPLDTSCWATQEASITMSSSFITAHEKGKNSETTFLSSETYSSGLTEPSGLSTLSASSLLRKARKESRNPFPVTQQSDPRKGESSPALSRASDYFINELPPPAQELLDEIENLKQHDATYKDFEEKKSHTHNMPMNVLTQINPEDKEEEEEFENKGEVDHSLWNKEILNLAEETERAHSTLDDLLERILQPIPEDDEVQGEPQGHLVRATNVKDQGDDEMENGIEEGGTMAESRKTESCAGNTEVINPEDQKPSLWQRLPWPSPFRVIVLDQSSASK
ncbi:inactive serine/threonine-protein kinase TEX14 isoform X2 [Pelodiscus sinensis]|uniref:inactive serine/threonine-protein kinase TEX14 isoform X2 n=1 Tax=Pelodiscus sinensis TaxID=13735 RepID=UPI003F6B5850